MSVIAEGIYNCGVVRLKKKDIKIPEDSHVLVIFKDDTNKERFLKSAGTWENVDDEVFTNILNYRKDYYIR